MGEKKENGEEKGGERRGNNKIVIGTRKMVDGERKGAPKWKSKVQQGNREQERERGEKERGKIKMKRMEGKKCEKRL